MSASDNSMGFTMSVPESLGMSRRRAAGAVLGAGLTVFVLGACGADPGPRGPGWYRAATALCQEVGSAPLGSGFTRLTDQSSGGVHANRDRNAAESSCTMTFRSTDASYDWSVTVTSRVYDAIGPACEDQTTLQQDDLHDAALGGNGVKAEKSSELGEASHWRTVVAGTNESYVSSLVADLTGCDGNLFLRVSVSRQIVTALDLHADYASELSVVKDHAAQIARSVKDKLWKEPAAKHTT